METALLWTYWILTPASVLRAAMWRHHDGPLRTIGTIATGMSGLALVCFTNSGAWVAGPLSLVGFFVVAKSPTEALSRRLDRLADRIGEGLELSLHSGIIPPAALEEGLMARGARAEDADALLNAVAAQHEDNHLVLVTPAAARLPDDELMFIVAHEVGHHALGHTNQGLLSRLFRFLQSPVGLLAGVASGFLLGAPLWAAALGGLLFKTTGSQLSQSDEHDADAWAVQRLRDLGMRTTGGVRVMERFAKLEGSGILLAAANAIFGTHPPPDDRKKRVQKAALAP